MPGPGWVEDETCCPQARLWGVQRVSNSRENLTYLFRGFSHENTRAKKQYAQHWLDKLGKHTVMAEVVLITLVTKS